MVYFHEDWQIENANRQLGDIHILVPELIPH